jgi:putative methyltransferase (TIGR01177 family)
MGDMLACLRGWHPALARAELEALLPTALFTATDSQRWWRVAAASPHARGDALSVASGLQCFLTDGFIFATESSHVEAWLEQVRTYLEHHPVDGTVAVRSWKQGEKILDWGPTTLAKRVGGVLHSLGYTIELEHPDHVFALITDAETLSLACGWMEGNGQAAFSNGERRAGERPFFKPVSLDPMLARLAVNLAAGPPSNGPVVDPMTGTGGFVIEASLSGRECIGLDIHSEMVQGAQSNLAWAHGGTVPGHSCVRRGDATRLQDALPEEWIGKVSGFVLDPPYGRNSHGTMQADALLESVLRSAREVASEEAGFVLIVPIHPMEPHPESSVPWEQEVPLLYGTWQDMLAVIAQCGWSPQSAHVERVHRSLSRLILHARCAPQD